jgi:cyclase
MGIPVLTPPGRTPPADLVEVADGVYAYVQAPGGWCLSNAGVVVGADGAVVIDTLATERRSRQLRTTVERLAGDRAAGPARTLVNTHHHGDHSFGNHVFGPAATVVAHDQARREMADTAMALTGLWPDVDWGRVELRLPTLTFPDRITLHLDERPVELIHVGPAHTTNDVVAWLPDDGVLFAGDVVLGGCTPFNLMGSIEGALAAVERLRRLGATTVVGGHGPVSGPALFDETTAYLRRVQELATQGASQGLTPLQVARQTDLGDFAHLIDPERIVGNLHRAYAELEAGPLGRPLDVAPIFGEMIEFNDGQLPTCLA